MSLAEKNLQNLHFALQCPSTRLLRLFTDLHRYKDAVRRGCAPPPLVRFHPQSQHPLPPKSGRPLYKPLLQNAFEQVSRQTL